MAVAVAVAVGVGVGLPSASDGATASSEGIAKASSAIKTAADATNNAIRMRRSKKRDSESNFFCIRYLVINRRFVVRIRHFTAAVQGRNDAAGSVAVAASL